MPDLLNEIFKDVKDQSDSLSAEQAENEYPSPNQKRNAPANGGINGVKQYYLELEIVFFDPYLFK